MTLQDKSPVCSSNFAVYYGTFIHTPVLGNVEIWLDTAVGVDADGTISFINKSTTLDDALDKNHLDAKETKIIDISNHINSFFFPGFIDTHIHAPQYPNNGIFGNSTLLDWLTTYTFPLEASMKDLSKAELVYEKVIRRTLSNGTTCASYFATIDPKATNLLADLAKSIGQKAFIGKVCMNDNSPDFYKETLEESKSSTLEVVKHIAEIDPDNKWVAPTITPRFAPSCTADLLSWLGDLRKEKDLACQTHVSENKLEIEWVRELFPDSKSYTDVYNDHGLLGKKTVLAHAVHLSDHEKDLIKSKGCGISHCPISNSSITSGEARVKWLLDNDIPVGLGTDVSGGFSPSILAVARYALLVSRHLAMDKGAQNKLSVYEVLYLATQGGARVLGLQDQIGSFQLGKKWDVQLVDLNAPDSRVDVFDWQIPGSPNDPDFARKYEDLIAKWLFNGDDRNTTSVWVNGRNVK